MNPSEQKRFDELYRKHLRALKLQGMSDKTIDAYSRAVRRVAAWFDGCPDRLEPEQLAEYFSALVESDSWSTVKLDRCGLQFFYKHVLDRDWTLVEMIRAPKIRSLPDNSECCRNRAPAWRGAQAALPGVCADHLFDGLAPGRNAGAGSRRYRPCAPPGPHPARQGPQGPPGAVAGLDLSGLAGLVVQASPPVRVFRTVMNSACFQDSHAYFQDSHGQRVQDSHVRIFRTVMCVFSGQSWTACSGQS